MMRVFYLAPFRCRKCRLRFYRPALFWYPTSAEPVRIPSVSRVAEPEAEPEAGPAVLILDDDPALRGLFRRLLERDGYQVHEASTSAQISEEVSEEILLLVANLNATSEDNLSAARTLQAMNPDLKVILLSDVIKARALQPEAVPGRLTILKTPLHPHDLIDTVRELLGSGVAVGRH
jgi:DNA-binding NtrC family response regulator